MTANTIGLMFGQSPFHIEVTGGTAIAVSEGTGMRMNLVSLETAQLLELKNLAHNQYVRAMLFDDSEIDVFRATLNMLCRTLERLGNPASRVPTDRRSMRPAPAVEERTARAA